MEAANPERKVTPFEKNIEVWRQLWRVLERSDFAIQIVDARNPTLYLCVICNIIYYCLIKLIF